MTPRAYLDWLHHTRGAPTARELADVGKPARHAGVERVIRDLRRLGIRQEFRFVWSGDGSGVEEDDPRVIHLHRPLVRADRAPRAAVAGGERAIGIDLAGVARHEVGHALLFLRPRAARSREFRQLFGDVDLTYRVGNPIDEVMRRIRRHRGLANPRYRRVVSLYAATHPHEAFAEAVRVALAHGADERELTRWAAAHDTAGVVAEQLAWVCRWLRSYGRA